jgi:iron complex transport system substrate-binding protein
MALRLLRLAPLVLLCAFTFVSSASSESAPPDPSRDLFPDKVAAEYSSYWSVRYESSYKVVTVSAPSIFPSWQPSGVFYNSTYVLVSAGSETPSASLFPDETRFFTVPFRRYALDSTTQAIHAEVLGELDSLVAYGSSSTPTSPCFQRRRSSYASIESWFGANETRRSQQIGSLNLDAQFSWPRLPHPKTISVPDTSDPSVLGRAEWLKFWSLWFNKEDIANRVFEGIVDRWECHQGAVRSLLSRSSTRSPRVAWISHTSSSVTFIQTDFIVDYLRAAGADVAVQSSLQPNVVSISNALVLLKDFDIVIDDGGRFTSFSLLLSHLGLTQGSLEYPWIQNRQVWTHDALQAPDGSTAWFESHLVEPDVMLEDLISIFYPRYQPNHRRTWFRSAFHMGSLIFSS